MASVNWKNFSVSQENGIVRLRLATESKSNSYNATFWFEMRDFLTSLAQDSSARVLIVEAEGRHFGGGMNVDYLNEMNVSKGDDPARYNHWIRGKILFFQEVIGLFDSLPIPVIGLAKGACIGGSMAFYAACDIRLSDPTAFYSIYEINVGIMCDLGTVQRVTRLCGETLSSYMAFTGESITAEKAATAGLVTELLDSEASMQSRADAIAIRLAGMSPLALAGLKETISAARDSHFSESLKASATWNAGMYTTSDIGLALEQGSKAGAATYPDLFRAEQ